MKQINNKIIRFFALTMAFAMVMALAGCVQEPQVTEPKAKTYTICVTNAALTPLEKCKVDVYSDDSLTGMIYTGITDKKGQVSFSDVAKDTYVAVVTKVHAGYDVSQFYPLTGESTNIVLKPRAMTDADMDSVTYSLGDPVMDFSVMTDGGEVVLSDLLQEKKAVVLNFWYLNCQPCKLEFPYIQEGYEQLGDDIAILALNPYDGTQEDVTAFRNSNGYTFTMAKCDERWANMMKVPSYPTTIIIDRYGNICLIHNGMLKNSEEFVDMLQYFVADDYEQTFFRSAGQIPTIDK
jgi:thiol-disulfide isomerase/thioredoxin